MDNSKQFIAIIDVIYNNSKSIDISYLHVFTYSERANTTALRIEDVIPISVRQERNKILTNLSLKKKRSFYESQLGKTHKVLWEDAENDGLMSGFTSNYVKVSAQYDESLVNTTQLVRLQDLDREGLATVDASMLTVSES